MDTRTSSYCHLDERWLPVVGYEGKYEVSDCGRVRSLPRIGQRPKGPYRIRGRLLALSGCNGRPMVALDNTGGRRVMGKAQHLVLDAFVGPRPEGFICCHYDDNSLNNHLSNLRWDTFSANAFDKGRNGNQWQQAVEACPWGHLLRMPNLRPANLREGSRACLACARGRAFARGRKISEPQTIKAITDDYYRRIMGEAA